jgi:hypothetical protein
MRYPAYGLAWHLWRRHRLGFSVITAYLVVEVIAAQTVPLSVWSKESSAASAAIPLVMIAMYLMAVFVNSDADFANTSSGYPSYLFTLPLRTRDLALWPMMFGMASVSLLYIAVASLIFVPRGIHAPLWWPAAMLASTVACLQAIMWSPIALPYLRAVLAVILLPSAIILVTAAFEQGVSEPVLVMVYLCTLPISIAGALSGLSRARKGQSAEWSWIPERRIEETTPVSRRVRSFKSPEAAQLWMEWKRNGIMLPLLVAATCSLFSVPLLFIRDIAPLKLVPPGAGTIEANVCLNILIASIWLPVWFSMVLGSGGRKTDLRRKDLTIHPFIATRPMTSMAVIVTKMKMAAWSAVAAWVVLLAFVCLWLISPAKEADVQAPLGLLLVRHLTAKLGLIILLALGALIAFTWKCQMDSLWVDLIGNKWLAQGYPLFFGVGVTIALTLGASGIDNPELVAKALDSLPAALWTAATVKLLARGWILRALILNRILSYRSAIIIVAGWLLVAISLLAILTLLVPSEFAQPKYLLVGVFLALPFARLGAAPLSLESNRHR